MMRRSVAMPPLFTEFVEAMVGDREGVGDAERAGMSGVRLRAGARARGTAGFACGDARTRDVEESERCLGATSKPNRWGGRGEAGVTEMWGLVIWMGMTGTGPAGPAARGRG